MRVTIGIPAYNEARYIQTTLETVASQSYGDLRVIISDNASTDETGEICRTYCERDSRFTYIRQPENLGGGRNSQFLFDIATTEYFMWLGAHDSISPNFIEQSVRALDQHLDVALAGGRIVHVDRSGNPLDTSHPMQLFSNRSWVRYLQSITLLENYAIINFLFRRKLLEGVRKPAVAAVDGFLISHLLWHGNVAYAEGVTYTRRMWDLEVAKREYMLRLRGSGDDTGGKRDYMPLFKLYQDDLTQLVAPYGLPGSTYRWFALYLLRHRRKLKKKGPSRVAYKLILNLFKVFFTPRVN